VVVVARDRTIRERKKREPISDENQRVALLSSLRQVDVAILGVEGNIYDTLERVKPDVVALGYDQHHMESEVEEEGKTRGVKLKVVRLDSPNPSLKTSALLKEF
jgi:FAD synthetase